MFELGLDDRNVIRYTESGRIPHDDVLHALVAEYGITRAVARLSAMVRDAEFACLMREYTERCRDARRDELRDAGIDPSTTREPDGIYIDAEREVLS